MNKMVNKTLTEFAIGELSKCIVIIFHLKIHFFGTNNQQHLSLGKSSNWKTIMPGPTDLPYLPAELWHMVIEDSVSKYRYYYNNIGLVAENLEKIARTSPYAKDLVSSSPSTRWILKKKFLDPLETSQYIGGFRLKISDVIEYFPILSEKDQFEILNICLSLRNGREWVDQFEYVAMNLKKLAPRLRESCLRTAIQSLPKSWAADMVMHWRDGPWPKGAGEKMIAKRAEIVGKELTEIALLYAKQGLRTYRMVKLSAAELDILEKARPMPKEQLELLRSRDPPAEGLDILVETGPRSRDRSKAILAPNANKSVDENLAGDAMSSGSLKRRRSHSLLEERDDRKRGAKMRE